MSYLDEVLLTLVTVLVAVALAWPATVLLGRSAPNSLQALSSLARLSAVGRGTYRCRVHANPSLTNGGLLGLEVDGDRVACADGGEQVLQWGRWGRVRPGPPVALQQRGRGQPGPDVPERDRPTRQQHPFVQPGLVGGAPSLDDRPAGRLRWSRR